MPNITKNSPNGLSVMAIIIFSHFFFASELSITIYTEILHLPCSLGRSYQYVSACRKISKYSKRFKRYGDFHKLIRGGRTRPGEVIDKKKSGI